MRALILALLVACGSTSEDEAAYEESSGDSLEAQTGETQREVSNEGAAELAAQGEVCRSGSDSGGDIARECEEGLRCCYPCGMEGCDYVCASSAECASWSRLP